MKTESLIEQIKKEAHEKAYQFSQSYIAHKYKGQFVVVLVHHFDNVAIPDYSQQRGIFTNSFQAQCHAKHTALCEQIGTMVVQI